MIELNVRRLPIDLDTPLPRHRVGGDALRTAFFDALPMSWPLGGPFDLGAVRGFVGQETMRRCLHARSDAHPSRRSGAPLRGVGRPHAARRRVVAGVVAMRPTSELTGVAPQSAAQNCVAGIKIASHRWRDARRGVDLRSLESR